MDDDYDDLGFRGLDLFLPGVDLTLWLRLILGARSLRCQIKIDVPERVKTLEPGNCVLNNVYIDATAGNLKNVEVLLSNIVFQHQDVTLEFWPEGCHNAIRPARPLARYQVTG